MGRSRMPLELIPKEKSRKLTFQKRALGLKKKASEISTLCGVDACMIVYSNNGSAVFYPSDGSMITAIIKRYREHSEQGRGMKTVDLSGFFEERVKKINKELSKLGDQGFDQSKHPVWDDCLNDLSVDQLREHIKGWDAKIEAIDSRIELLKMEQALLQGPYLMNPNPNTNSNTNFAGNAAGASTQGVYTQYASPIDSMPLMPNSMANPLMSKLMMTHFSDGPSFNNQYSAPLRHPFFYDQTRRMMDNTMLNAFVPSPYFYQPIMPSLYMPPMLNGAQANKAFDYDVSDNKQGIRFG